MLVIKRRVGEKLVIGNGIEVRLDNISSKGKVALNISSHEKIKTKAGFFTTKSKNNDVFIFKGDTITINDNVIIHISSLMGDSQIKVGIDAPRDIFVLRMELLERESLPA